MGINVGSPLAYERSLAERPSPILSDGTPLSALFDLDKREVKLRVLGDPEIHRLELHKVFARSWIIVGHASEIPNAGDYVKRQIGQDQVIVARGRDGEISILLNACSHRGMEICWADHGNQASFKCPYHGWVFDHAGNLMGAPFEKEMYGDWDKSQYGLAKAQVTVRHGVIFGAFKPLGDLDDWLGEFGWYFDLIYGSTELEAVGGASSPTRIAANWKAAAEQHSGDGYHTASLHYGLVELGMFNPSADDLKSWTLDCCDTSSYEGHGVRIAEIAHAVAHMTPAPEPFPIGWYFAGSIFPTTLLDASANRSPDVGGDVVRIASLSPVSPHGAGSYSQWNLDLVQKDLPEDVKKSLGRMASANIAVIDDLATWPSMTRVAGGAIGEQQPMRYNALLGPNKPADWPGPALVHQGFSKDDNQWHFWLRWYDLMTTE